MRILCVVALLLLISTAHAGDRAPDRTPPKRDPCAQQRDRCTKMCQENYPNGCSRQFGDDFTRCIYCMKQCMESQEGCK